MAADASRFAESFSQLFGEAKSGESVGVHGCFVMVHHVAPCPWHHQIVR